MNLRKVWLIRDLHLETPGRGGTSPTRMIQATDYALALTPEGLTATYRHGPEPRRQLWIPLTNIAGGEVDPAPVESPNAPESCPDCGAEFNGLAALKSHRRAKHAAAA